MSDLQRASTCPLDLSSAPGRLPPPPMLSVLTALLLAQSPCGPLDLPAALDLAGRRSDEVAIKQSDVAAAGVDLALAKALMFLPGSTLTAYVGPDPGSTGNATAQPGSPGYPTGTNRGLQNVGIFERVDVQLLQPIFTWGQLTGARDMARAEIKARTDLVDDALSHVQLRVIELYWGDALARKFLAIAAEVEKSLGEVDTQIQRSLKDEDGSVSPQDRFQIALFRSELAGRKAEAVRGQELARIGLAATLALPRDRLALREVSLTPAPVNVPGVEASLAQAELRRADLRALDAAIEAKEAEVRIRLGAMLPQVFVAGEFSYAYAYNREIQFNPWIIDPFNELTLGAVLGIRQDLALPALYQQKRKTETELAGLHRQRDGLVRLLQTQVEGATAELTAARDRLKAAQEGLTAGKSWFRAAGLDFQAGVGDAKALLLAYKGYVESQVAAAQAAYDQVVAKARLDQATAVPLGPGPAQGEAQCTLQ